MSGEMWAELGLKNTKTNTLINYQTEILDIFEIKLIKQIITA
jgi:hypothetical protein